MIGPGMSRIGRSLYPEAAGRWLWPLLPILALGCDRIDQRHAANRPVPADRVVDFAVLYKENCAGCHGADGMLGPALR